MKNLLKGFLLQLQFFTAIPFPWTIPYTAELLSAGFVTAPAIGLLIGLLLAGIRLLAACCGQPLLTALTVVTAGVLVTGGLHLDGLADTCDGLASRGNREKILAIMKDSRIGVFGTLAIVLLLAWKISLLYLLAGSRSSGYLICMPVVARIMVVLAAGISGYAGRPGGMGAVYAARTGPRQIVLAALGGILLCLPFGGIAFFLPLLSVAGYTLIFHGLLQKKIGGITGDTLGYIIEMSEVIFLSGAFLQETWLFRG